VFSRRGDITHHHWDVFRLAFQTTGRVAVLNDRPAHGWMYDYRFPEAVP